MEHEPRAGLTREEAAHLQDERNREHERRLVRRNEEAARRNEEAARLEAERAFEHRYGHGRGLPEVAPTKAFECVECGRWAEVLPSRNAYSQLVQTELGFSLPDWVHLWAAARQSQPLRPAFLQREFGKNYDESVKTLDAAVRLGLLDATAKGVVAAQPRCSECYERRATAPEAGQSAPKARDPIPPQLRFRVLQRDNFRCQYCGRSARDGATLHLDHVVPVAAGGETSEDNLITACETCNLGKSAGEVV